MSKLKPRQRRKQRTKQEILDTALSLVIEKGPNNLSLREVARRVDYSPAGLYEYFGSKDEILSALCHEGNIRLSAYLNGVSTDLPPVERLVELGLAYIKFALQNREHYLLVFTHLPSDRTSTAEPVPAEDPYAILLQAVQDGISAGVFVTRPGFSVEEIAYSCWALVHGMSMLQLIQLQNFQADFETANRRGLQAFVQGLTLNSDD